MEYSIVHLRRLKKCRDVYSLHFFLHCEFAFCTLDKWPIIPINTEMALCFFLTKQMQDDSAKSWSIIFQRKQTSSNVNKQ